MSLAFSLLGYIDPVSGTLIIQLVVAGVLGTIGFFRKSIWKAVCLVTGRKPTDNVDDEDDEDVTK